jgi:adenine-specific DNA-methyltransferase
MVEQSLFEYLKTKTNIDEDKLKAVISYEDKQLDLSEDEKKQLIYAIDSLKIIDPAVGSGAFPMGVLHRLVHMLGKIDPDNSLWRELQLKKALQEVEKVLEKYGEDREEREKLLKEIIENFDESRNYPDYARKLYLIENSIYGVDIQNIAVQICKLRFFLSLVIDQKVDKNIQNFGIKPLPHLETKFVCADTLIGLEKPEQLSLSDSALKNLKEELREVYKRFFRVKSRQEKKRLEEKANKIRQEIKTALKRLGFPNETLEKIANFNIFSQTEKADWFDPEWMFGVEDGFDIVIGNPPYVGEKGHKEMFRKYRKGPLRNYYQAKMDIFYFFFHQALNIGKQGSHIAFITTNYYPTATGAKKLRLDFKKRAIIKKLINFNELKIFRDLGEHNMITILQKGQDDNAVCEIYITKRKGYAEPEILQKIFNKIDEETSYFKILQKDLYEGEECYIRLTGSRAQNPVDIILDKIKSQGSPLASICNINQGIVTGADKVNKKHIENYKIKAKIGDGIFVLSQDEIRILNFSSFEKSILRPWYKNSDIKKWYTNNETTEFVLYLNGRYKQKDIPNIINHLSKFKEILQERREVHKGSRNWYDLWWSREEKIFNGPKILVPHRSYKNTFGYNEIPWYASADVYFITEKDSSISLKYILALLNSKLYYFWLYHKGKRKGEMLELYWKPLSEIPIKKIDKNQQQPFIQIVDKILSLAQSSDYESDPQKQAKVKDLEKQIDHLVYKLYNLTEEEIKIIEGGDI